MFKNILFIVSTCAYLYLLDARIVLYRIFWRRGLEGFVNRVTKHYAVWILDNARRLMGIRLIDHSDRALMAALPARFVAVTNHQSLFDIIMVFKLFLDNDMRFVAKKALGRGFPGVSQILWYGRHALIDRKGGARATFEAITALAKRCARRGYNPVIFPEGTRSRDGSLGTFHPAGLRMILDQGSLPLVVAALDGGYRMATVRDFLGRGSKLLRMKVLAVIPAPANKEEAMRGLERAKELIDSQLADWRR